ncbi:MAG: phosphotransferase [Chloroflexales bacterium]|nr:phosphotransferase [Chloroflexales bacterium]
MSSLRPIKVLIVDNNPRHREDYADFVRAWGYRPVIAEGEGQALRDHARQLAHAERCPLALVDLRLVEDKDPSDRSGLTLIGELGFTRSIILTSFGTIRTAMSATEEHGAAGFVEKTEHPEVLRRQLQAVAERLRLNGSGPLVFWADGASSQTVRDEMFPGRADIPADEAEVLIRRLYPDSAVVRLTGITSHTEQAASDGAGAHDLATNLRRGSRVFVAEIDGEPALQVVKLARTDKIEREAERFRGYVEGGLRSARRPEMIGTVLLWDMGVIAYRLLGYARLDEGRAQILTRVYRREADPARLIAPLHDFFGLDAWGHWYHSQVQALEGTLVEAYERSWGDALARHHERWARQAPELPFEPVAAALPNPTRWYVDNYPRCAELGGLRQAITHGDLHGDNLFVDEADAWPVDFERTGYGPILRDFVELAQDLSTRIAALDADDLPLIYDIALAIAAPRSPDEPMRPTQAILAHPEAYKLFQILEELQRLALLRTQYCDRREFLWGLLCNHLFVASKLDEASPRWARTMLYAAVICHRLDHWDEGQ